MAQNFENMQIHPSAIISSKAKIGENSKIGPFCVVGCDVTIEDNVTLHPHVIVDGITHIGEGTEIYPFASIGCPPQDLKYLGEPSKLIIGKKNVIRENVTMNPGTKDGGMGTYAESIPLYGLYLFAFFHPVKMLGSVKLKIYFLFLRPIDLITATCFLNSFMGTAGDPPTTAPSPKLFATPDCAAIWTLFPIFMCPASPD